MRKLKKYLCVICMSFLYQSNILIAQNSSTDSLDQQILKMQNLYKTAKDYDADLFCEKYFNSAERYVIEIQAQYPRNKRQLLPDTIQKTIELLNKSIGNTEKMLEHYGDYIAPKKYALSIRADSLDKENWKKAEESLYKLLDCIEKSKTDDEKIYARGANTFYNLAIVNTLKKKNYFEFDSMLSLHNKDMSKNAPITLQKALLLKKKGESQIEKDKYETEEVIQIVQAAHQEIKHSINICKCIKEINDEKVTYEQIFLREEDRLQRLAGIFNIYIEFDKGIENSLEELILKIRDLNKQFADIDLGLVEKEQEIETLQLKIDEYRKKLAYLSTIQDSLIVTNKSTGAIFNEYSSLQNDLKTIDYNITYETERIILRIPNSIFAKGKEYIKSENFGKLQQVASCLQKMNNCCFTIEGHTNLQGNAENNKNVSQKRANAIREFLFANASSDQNQYIAIGYGESKPISSNNTIIGKENNNRIDIIICRR